MQLVSTESVRLRHYTEELRPVEALHEFMTSLRKEGRSGKLVLNYVNGAPRGFLEWTERQKE